MAYELNKFNGTYFTTVDDQTLNTTSTDLRFVGRNYSGYGEVENENLLHLLENFANSSAPPRAIAGQIWFDTSTKKLKVYDGTKFKVVSGAESSATAPVGLVTGDFWWDTQNEQLFSWNGDEFILVGPEKVPVYGETSAAPAVVKDVVNSSKQIIKLQVNGEVIAIVSDTDFTISQFVNPIAGFNEIKKGITFINSSLTTGETSSAHRFWGTAANSDRLGGYTADAFLRYNNTSFQTQVYFRDVGFRVGDGQDLQVHVINGNTPTIESRFSQPIVLRISDDGNDVDDVALVKRAGLEPGSNRLYDLGALISQWKTVYAEEVKADTFYGTFVGNLESTNPSTPLSMLSVNLNQDFSMVSSNNTKPVGGAGTAVSDATFTVNLLNTTGLVTIKSGVVGTIDNFNINPTVPGTGAFTTLSSNNTVRFTATSASTSTTTGTLIVSGGVGVAGALHVGADSKFTSVGGLGIPAGSTAQRPAAPSVGMIRFNTTISEWEGWDGVEWRSIGGDANQDYGQVTASPTAFVDLGGLY